MGLYPPDHAAKSVSSLACSSLVSSRRSGSSTSVILARMSLMALMRDSISYRSTASPSRLPVMRVSVPRVTVIVAFMIPHSNWVSTC